MLLHSFRYVLKNLKPGEAIVVIDYKMKLELGMHSREIQRYWYGKRGISLHGFYVIAQVTDSERHIEVLDLWSEDTKQDAWFTQSALDIGFAWMEKVFPNFQVYLFFWLVFSEHTCEYNSTFSYKCLVSYIQKHTLYLFHSHYFLIT